MINTQTRTFDGVNYVNAIGSKVVIRPLAETFEISAKKDLQLQCTVVLLDPASASQDAMATGDAPPGEVPEAKEEAVAADSPSGEMAVAEEDVEMDAPEEELKEEAPQEDPQDAQMPATQDFMAALRPEADENLSSAQSSLAFVLEGKTIKDFIQTRCHSFSHWSLNQR